MYIWELARLALSTPSGRHQRGRRDPKRGGPALQEDTWLT